MSGRGNSLNLIFFFHWHYVQKSCKALSYNFLEYLLSWKYTAEVISIWFDLLSLAVKYISNVKDRNFQVGLYKLSYKLNFPEPFS